MKLKFEVIVNVNHSLCKNLNIKNGEIKFFINLITRGIELNKSMFVKLNTFYNETAIKMVVFVTLQRAKTILDFDILIMIYHNLRKINMELDDQILSWNFHK